MRSFLIILSFLFFCLSANAQKSDPIVKVHQARFQSMMQKDTAELKQYLHGDLLYVHSNGFLETKQSHLQNIATGTVQYHVINPVSMQVKRYKRTGIVQGQILVSGVFKGYAFDITLNYIATYVKQKGKWRMISWQSSKQ